MGALGEPKGDVSRGEWSQWRLPSQLCLFSMLVILAELPGWWMSYRHESTPAGATTDQ